MRKFCYALLIPYLFLVIFCLQTQAKKLAFKDGTIEEVDSYEIINIDRAGKNKKVRYLSSDRNTWEEAPLDAIDLQRTDTLNKELAPSSKKRKSDKPEILTKEEHERFRAHEQLAAKNKPLTIAPGIVLPDSPLGVYSLEGTKLIPLNKSPVKIRSDKKRVLVGLAGAPVRQKKIASLEGRKSAFRLHNDKQSFYLNFTNARQVKLLRLKPRTGQREISETYLRPILGTAENKEQDIVPTTLDQVEESAFKITPTQSLPPGEYGFVITPQSNPLVSSPITIELEVWDFGVDMPKPAHQ